MGRDLTLSAFRVISTGHRLRLYYLFGLSLGAGRHSVSHVRGRRIG
jgi:hypothetical protein